MNGANVSSIFKTILLTAACLAGLSACSTTPTFNRDELFITKTSSKSPAQVHQAIRDYVVKQEWLYVGDNKLKGGEVTQVRICVPKLAGDVWNAGMHVTAMMPCGHMGIYQEGGVTKVSMLHPRFLTVLDPHPAVKKLADDVTGPYLTMLDAITK